MMNYKKINLLIMT